MLQDKYQSAETQNLAKDAVVLMKKYEAVKNRGDKIADLLAASLEQHCQDAQVQEQRWINATKEKVAWCGDIAGDRYSMEAKLATVKVSYNHKRKMEFILQDLKFTEKTIYMSYFLCYELHLILTEIGQQRQFHKWT